ncbi:hypothetical protein EET67_09890 [Pseudaminobacter arsenicus]|uniref:Uncharacterized protein n=1 Tax=Borborobacter arsenicus TaxID=1851146 RepID=A0A432V6X5_9HYPH|nr:hypothetical protein [Pseudaminobacter arsenicus]RUM97916.1 hypothetical protein EET67_09890 [Pseudaminobacter arsenicus]
MRRPCRQAQRRIRQGCGKKLRRAFRWRLTGEGPNNWLKKLAAENPAEAQFIKVQARPDEAKAELWHDFYWRAFEALRFDRQYGAFGGETAISFLAIDAYARRYCIEGEAFDRFLTFMTAIDAEWLQFVAEEAKKREADK